MLKEKLYHQIFYDVGAVSCVLCVSIGVDSRFDIHSYEI